MRLLSSCIIFLMLLVSVTVIADNKERGFLFSYFMGNGEDGLHLAYSYDGFKWNALNNNKSFLKPEVGSDKLMRDPCIIKGKDGLFHMVWTVSWKEKGIGYANSPDLVNWSDQKYIPVMEHEAEARNCWAPEVFYDDGSDQYIIFWSTTIPGRFPVSASKGDNKHNHRMYYVTTRDFENFSDTKLFYDQDFNVIDGTLIKEEGQFVLFLKDETRYPPEKNIRIAFSDSLTVGYGKASNPITGDYWAEGPTPIKINDYWVVYFDKYRKHKMGAVRSKDLKYWEDISEKISFPKGTRHGTVIEVDMDLIKRLTQQ